MKRKSSKFSGRRVMCNKCGHECHGVPDTQHRRCGGSEGAALKGKREKLPSTHRGMWV